MKIEQTMSENKKVQISITEDTEYGNNRIYINIPRLGVEILVECPLGHSIDELEPRYSVGDGWMPIPMEDE